MSALFLLVAFPLLIILFEANVSERDWRRSFLLSALVWSVFLVVAVEGLSLFTLLSVGPIVFLWVIFDTALLVLLISRRQRVVSWRPPSFEGLGWDEWLMVVCGALLITLTLVVALIAPPNSWDAMTYHMPRVMHWIQNQTVAFYPTHNIRQVYMPPFAEYVILGFQLLTGGDRFANIPQFFSWGGSGVAVSLIARSLGAKQKGQLLAAALALTIPPGILQATGAKNGCVLTFWFVTFIWFGLLWKEKMDDPKRAALAGLALGFALLTKGTAYVLVLPFIAWFGIAGVAAIGKSVWRPVLIVALLAVTMNAPLYVRNMALFDHPLGTMAEEFPHLKPTNDIYTPKAIVSNIVRNAALHFGTSSHFVNNRIYHAIIVFHEVTLGADANDPATTWIMPFRVPVQSMFRQGEAITGARFHLLLAMVCFFFPLLDRYSKPDRNKLLIQYVTTVVAVFLLFVTLFKWTPFNVRYHLPMLLLLPPFMGLMLERSKVTSRVIMVMTLIFIAQAIPPALMSSARPLLPLPTSIWRHSPSLNPAKEAQMYNDRLLFSASRRSLLFVGDPGRERPYRAAAKFIGASGCRDIGFITDQNNDPSGQAAMEYQFRGLLRQPDKTPLLLRHVNVKNKTRALTSPIPSTPCAILKLNQPNNFFSDKPYVQPSDRPIEVSGKHYKRAFFDSFVGVYLPNSTR